MGFGNGYDSGYSDAIEDVRNGKVAGLGPASGEGVTGPTAEPTFLDALDTLYELQSAIDDLTYDDIDNVWSKLDVLHAKTYDRGMEVGASFATS